MCLERALAIVDIIRSLCPLHCERQLVVLVLVTFSSLQTAKSQVRQVSGTPIRMQGSVHSMATYYPVNESSSHSGTFNIVQWHQFYVLGEIVNKDEDKSLA